MAATMQELIWVYRGESQPMQQQHPGTSVSIQTHSGSKSASPSYCTPWQILWFSQECKGFLMQCSILSASSPSLYNRDVDKIRLVLLLLTRRALTLVTAIFDQTKRQQTFTEFRKEFWEVFDHPVSGQDACERLHLLRQINGELCSDDSHTWGRKWVELQEELQWVECYYNYITFQVITSQLHFKT